MTSKLDGLVRVEAVMVIWFRDGSMDIKVFNLVGCQSTLKSFCLSVNFKIVVSTCQIKNFKIPRNDQIASVSYFVQMEMEQCIEIGWVSPG